MLLLLHAYVNIADKTQVLDSLKKHFHILIKSRLIARTNHDMVLNCLSIKNEYDNTVITFSRLR